MHLDATSYTTGYNPVQILSGNFTKTSTPVRSDQEVIP